MSLATYQQCQLLMIRDAGRTQAYARGEFGELADRLTVLERQRLQSQAADAGMALVRKLHEGWRLTKLLTLLPRTFAVGDPDVLSQLVAEFWRTTPPRTLYFESEAADFARIVAQNSPTESLLHELAVLEGAFLEASSHRIDPGMPISTFRLNRDPRELMKGLQRVPQGGVAFDTTLWSDGESLQLEVRRVRL